jgi:hypothetical protein
MVFLVIQKAHPYCVFAGYIQKAHPYCVLKAMI